MDKYLNVYKFGDDDITRDIKEETWETPAPIEVPCAIKAPESLHLDVRMTFQHNPKPGKILYVQDGSIIQTVTNEFEFTKESTAYRGRCESIEFIYAQTGTAFVNQQPVLFSDRQCQVFTLDVSDDMCLGRLQTPSSFGAPLTVTLPSETSPQDKPTFSYGFPNPVGGLQPLYFYGYYAAEGVKPEHMEPIFARVLTDELGIKLYRLSFLESQGVFYPEGGHVKGRTYQFDTKARTFMWKSVHQFLISGGLKTCLKFDDKDIFYVSDSYKVLNEDRYQLIFKVEDSC